MYDYKRTIFSLFSQRSIKYIYLMQENGKDCRISNVVSKGKRGNFHETVTDCG